MKLNARILVVEDDPSQREMLAVVVSVENNCYY